MQNLISLVEGLDIRYVYLAVAILGVTVVVSFIKKAVKVGIAVLIIALLISYGGVWASKIQEKYNVNIEEGSINITIDGKVHNINLEETGEIVATDLGNGKVKLTIKGNDEHKSIQTEVVLLRFMYDTVKRQANKLGIKVTEK